MDPFDPVPEYEACSKIISSCIGDLHSEFMNTTHACGEEGGDC